jgi:glucose/arabinose dehydrogenase
MLVENQLLNDSQFGSISLNSSNSSSTFPGSYSKNPQTIVFVDANIADSTQVMSGVQADVKVLLDPTRDGVAQITETLQYYKNLASIDIISHGNVAQLQLGNSSLDTDSLKQYASTLEQWKASLTVDADILFFGCNVAEGATGQAFVNRVGSLTRADIAASNDPTGAGGDWLLEYATGKIEAVSPLTDNLTRGYQGQLATLFTNQTPSQPNFTDGTGSAGDYELGMEFRSAKAGKINAIRYYKSPSETGTHVGRIWSSTGQLLGSVTFTNETASGWQQQDLTTSISIAAGTTYVVSVNVKTHYPISQNGFNSAIANGDLTGSNGVFNFAPGLFPTQSWNNSNYFRDVDFTPSAPNPNNTVGTVSISGTRTQKQTLTANVADVNGLTSVTINYQWQQLSGSTWSNIGGATARTLTLQQAQVGKQVRVRATYTDALGSNENILSSATTAVANVNDVGTAAITGTTAQNQTLTANVTDADGLTSVTVNYRWQQLNGSNWTNITGATAKTFTLQQAQVGKQVRVNATYADVLGGSENIFSPATSQISAVGTSLTSIFAATATPNQTNFTDGSGVDWEYGMQFSSNQSGQIQAIRYYKAPSETGTHIGRIWSSTGELLASVNFTNETASGWQQQALATSLAIEANATYAVSVNANSYYATTLNGFNSSITSGSLTAPVGAGVYNETVGTFPSLIYSNENYFRDVVFAASSSSGSTTTALRDSATIFVDETAGVATVRVVRTGNTQERTTVEYTTNEIGGAGAAQAGADFTQPTFNGRANTGQVVFEIGETEKSFTIPIVNDSSQEGNETFAIGLQNPSSGSLSAPRTVLITIVDDDSPNTISVSEPTVNVSEAGSTATITVQRSGNLAGAASVNFATSNGTAIAGADYTARTGTLNFDAGQATKTISIPILNDTIGESNEIFTLRLSSATGAILGSDAKSTITILDNDLNLGNLDRQTAVSGLDEPTALDWTPDGRYMLVAQKSGAVRVVNNGTLRSTPLINLSSQVNNASDRGLLGLAIHPNFASNPYVYLLYTYDPPETVGRSGLAGPDGEGNRPSRLVRVTVNLSTMIADPASLVVLVGTNSTWAYTSRPDLDSTGAVGIAPSGIVNGTTITAPADQIDVGNQDNDPDRAGIQNQNIRDYLATDSTSHSIGAVQFGSDGWLYLSNGDGTSYNFVDPRAVRVQDIDNLSGKVLRINPITGEGVPDNPYYEVNDPDSNRSKVFYSGVRNAFRFTFDPITDLPVVGDVGWNSWEEINTGVAGSNFGWPYLEGLNQTGGYQDLAQAISFYNNGNRNNSGDQAAVFPILRRSHGAPDNANAIMVGDFYNSNTLMFGDVIGGTLYAATLNSSRQITNVQVFDANIPYVVDMEMGPDGRLYGLDLVTGSILRWDPA